MTKVYEPLQPGTPADVVLKYVARTLTSAGIPITPDHPVHTVSGRVRPDGKGSPQQNYRATGWCVSCDCTIEISTIGASLMVYLTRYIRAGSGCDQSMAEMETDCACHSLPEMCCSGGSIYWAAGFLPDSADPEPWASWPPSPRSGPVCAGCMSTTPVLLWVGSPQTAPVDDEGLPAVGVTWLCLECAGLDDPYEKMEKVDGSNAGSDPLYGAIADNSVFWQVPAGQPNPFTEARRQFEVQIALGWTPGGAHADEGAHG